MRSRETLHRLLALGLAGTVGGPLVILQGCQTTANKEPAGMTKKATNQGAQEAPKKVLVLDMAKGKHKVSPRLSAEAHKDKDASPPPRLVPPGPKTKELTELAKKGRSKKPAARKQTNHKHTRKIVRYVKGRRHGAGKVMFSNGQVRLSYRYTKGKREGIWKSFFRNGKPRLVREYRGGRLEGKLLRFFSNGQKRREIHFQAGKRHGAFLTWRRSGKQHRVGFYRKGVRDGEWLRFRQDGRLLSKRIYKDGTLERKTTIHDYKGRKYLVKTVIPASKTKILVYHFKDGQKRARRVFQDGKRHGTWVAWSPEGKMLWSRAYKQGRPDGIWRRIFKDRETEVLYVAGKRKSQRTTIFKQGNKRYMLVKDLEKKRSKWVGFFPDGSKKYEYQAIQGKRHGRSVEWFKNGQKKRVAHYNGGDLHGPWKCWNESGSWSMEGEYRDGKKHGSWKVWRGPSKHSPAKGDTPKSSPSTQKKRSESTEKPADISAAKAGMEDVSSPQPTQNKAKDASEQLTTPKKVSPKATNSRTAPPKADRLTPGVDKEDAPSQGMTPPRD